ncbi:MAG: hypothetical protein U9Q83_09295, partial [Bacteroidota bacterium]|nr:hypothetical protein [Bacteroidota bacterium]
MNKKAELSKKDNDDELVFYERQKKKHKEIVREFFMDRVKKISRISELLKLEKKDNKQGDEIDPLEQKVASIRNPERQQDVKTEVVEHKKKDKVDEIKKDVEDDIFAKIAKLKKEKIDSQLDKKETEEKGGFVKEDVNKEKDSEALEELI